MTAARPINLADINSAIRALGMLRRTPKELDAIEGQHKDSDLFLSQAIACAARTVAADKRRNGHADD